MNKQNYIKPKAISVFSGLLYLNDDFEGGEFIFADYKRHIQVKKNSIYNLNIVYLQFTIYIYIYTIKLFPSLIKCSVSCTIERFNWIMVKIQLSFKYSEFHVNYFTILSLITTLSTDVTKSLQCKGIFLSDVTWSHA